MSSESFELPWVSHSLIFTHLPPLNALSESSFSSSVLHIYSGTLRKMRAIFTLLTIFANVSRSYWILVSNQFIWIPCLFPTTQWVDRRFSSNLHVTQSLEDSHSSLSLVPSLLSFIFFLVNFPSVLFRLDWILSPLAL